MVFKNLILIMLISIGISGCALWPYEKSFDCPTPDGVKCKSLYEVSEMADQGFFGPNAKKNINKNGLKARSKTKHQKRGDNCHVCSKYSS